MTMTRNTGEIEIGLTKTSNYKPEMMKMNAVTSHSVTNEYEGPAAALSITRDVIDHDHHDNLDKDEDLYDESDSGDELYDGDNTTTGGKQNFDATPQ
eukprot:UN10359